MPAMVQVRLECDGPCVAENFKSKDPHPPKVLAIEVDALDWASPQWDAVAKVSEWSFTGEGFLCPECTKAGEKAVAADKALDAATATAMRIA